LRQTTGSSFVYWPGPQTRPCTSARVGDQQGFVVRKERPLVANHFEFDPIRQARFLGQVRRPDGIVRRVAGRRVGQEKNPGPIDPGEQRTLTARP
jgi:hypothetical protein